MKRSSPYIEIKNAGEVDLHALDAAAEYVPATQLVQTVETVAAEIVEYFPAAQVERAVRPVLAQ